MRGPERPFRWLDYSTGTRAGRAYNNSTGLYGVPLRYLGPLGAFLKYYGSLFCSKGLRLYWGSLCFPMACFQHCYAEYFYCDPIYGSLLELRVTISEFQWRLCLVIHGGTKAPIFLPCELWRQIVVQSKKTYRCTKQENTLHGWYIL